MNEEVAALVTTYSSVHYIFGKNKKLPIHSNNRLFYYLQRTRLVVLSLVKQNIHRSLVAVLTHLH